MRRLSKSKLIAFRQCPKRLWLEIHCPELRDDSGSEVVFRVGNEVGEVARRVYDPEGDGSLTDIEELGYDEAFRRSARLLKAGEGPVFDLHPIAKAHFYAPSQHGSWSLKAVLPAACPELSYDTLEGVADGGMAVEAYREAIAPETTEKRRHAIERELLAYCHLDTLALVRLWEVFRGGSGTISQPGGG